MLASLLSPIVRLIERLKRLRIVQLFAINLRYLIGSAFVFAGMPKVMGERFTNMSVDTPVGFFFEAMYQTGFYWNFLGWGQVVAALLLMTQRFATLGALLFYPIMINVWLITWSVGFKGTPTVTFLMFLANTWLLIWDYRKLTPLFLSENRLWIPPSDFDDAFMRKPVWIILGAWLALCSGSLRLDFGHAKWYLLGGFLPALALLVYGFIIKNPPRTALEKG